MNSQKNHILSVACMPIPSILQKTRSSDSTCNSFSIRKRLQIYYNLVSAISGIRTHTLCSNEFEVRLVYQFQHYRILYQMSTIQYKLWTLFLRVNLLRTSLILDTRVELVFPAWKTGVLTIRRIELIMNIFIFIIFIMYILYHNF